MTTEFFINTANQMAFSLQYSEIPPPSEISNRQIVPFKINITAPDIGEHVIDLYAQYSNSRPHQEPHKWSHLVPQWRFTDVDGNIIDSITTTDTPVYSGTDIIGVSGVAEFYFIDDSASTYAHPVIIWTTMQVSGLPLYSESKDEMITNPSYANSKIVTFLPYFVNGLSPTELHITRNGVDPLSSSVYWINQKIPSVITIHGSNDLIDFCGYNTGPSMIYDYPSANDIGFSNGEINKQIITLGVNDQIWNCLENSTSSAYFQAVDTQGFRMGGYSRNTVVADLTTFNTQITAGANVTYVTPYRETPFLWVANPDNNFLHKIYYPNVDSSIIVAITSWLENQSDIFNVKYNTPFLSNRPEVMCLTGFGGIYGMAVDQCYNVWATDAELDKIYKFNFTGDLLSSIDLSDSTLLSSYGVSGGCTPSNISLDSVSSIWVSLFDSASVLKFNRNTGELVTIINPQGNQIQHIGGFGVDMDYKPTVVETDRNDNIWVSFTNTLCSTLQKYNSEGTPLFTVTLPTCSNPMDILIDYQNNVWVTLTKHAGPPYLTGSVLKINGTTGSTISSISAIHPEYITMDRTGNIFYTYGFNNVGKIDLNGVQTSFVVGTTTQPSWYDPNSQLDYNSLEGIAGDMSDRVWIINSFENKVYILSGNGIINSTTLYGNAIEWYLDANLNVQILTSVDAKSLQAFGDWSGLRYLQKYFTLYPQVCTAYLTGHSSLFNIDDFNGYDIRKFNESWDATTQIRDYALPEHLYSNYNLFVNYIGTMIGGLETSAKSIGRQIYERTANFVPNHNDVTTCNINKLYSLANEINAPIDDYNFQYPADLKRIMDIVSIPHKTLWGDRCTCALNFKGTYGVCDNCGHRHSSNKGEGIDSDTYVVSADVPFIAEYKFQRGTFELINPTVSSLNIFNVASGYLINDPEDFCYFTYIPTQCKVQNEGIISWDDEYTTLSEQSSGINEWYGNGQLVEKMINYLLHKGLGF
jgi:hypothetical protein